MLTAILFVLSAATIAQLAQAQDAGGPQLNSPRLFEPAQRALFSLPEDLKFNFAQQGSLVDSPAVKTGQMTKLSHPFLSTLQRDGMGQVALLMKPCSFVKPHVHPRANELHTIVYGSITGLLAQELGSADNLTVTVGPGEVFIVPQGLLHFWGNLNCKPAVLFQSYDNADPGSVDLVNAFASLEALGGAPAQLVSAAGAGGLSPSPYVTLDATCLKKCGYPKTGAPGDGLHGLPWVLKALLKGSPAPPS